MSRGDGRALEAAEGAMLTFVATENVGDVPAMAQATYDAIIDALLSELPEEAVEAAIPAWLESEVSSVGHKSVAKIVSAFLLSLRSSSRGADGG